MATESEKIHNNPGLEDSPGQFPQKAQEMEYHGKAKRPRGWIQGLSGEGRQWINSVKSLSVHLSLHHPQGSQKGFSQMSRVYLGLDDLNCSLCGKHKILFGELWRQLKLKPDFSIWWDI